MENYKKGKYVELLNKTLSRDEIIYLAKRFGLHPSANADLRFYADENAICVYEELTTPISSEILTSVVFSDFSVKSDVVFEGTREYVEAQAKFRAYMANLAEHYMQDFTMYLLEQERQISKRYEAQKQEDRRALEQELGLNYNEETLEK